MNTLARFKADPEKVRVSIQPQKNGKLYSIMISSRLDYNNYIQECDIHPANVIETIDSMLERVKNTIPGIDVGMEWAYDHPQK